MSKQRNLTITCPGCEQEQESLVWDSINTKVDPNLRETLFKGEINQFVCKNCEHKAFLNTALLYHDMTNKFCVQYYPPQEMQAPDFFDFFEPEFPVRIKNQMPEELMHLAPDYLMKPHIVFNMDDLLYTILFYENLLKSKSDSE